MRIYSLIFILTVALFGYSSAALAQSVDVVESDSTVITEDIVVESVEVEEVLETAEVKVIEEVPSNFGLFWRGIRERVNIGLTFDPVKKAEKQLRYAEERLHLAEVIATNATDEKVKAQAEKMVERAETLMKRIEEKADVLLEKKGEKVEKLLERVANHQVNRERILDGLEEKLPVETADRLRERREDMQVRAQDFLDKVIKGEQGKNIREHVESVKNVIQEKHEQLLEYKEEHRGLLQEIKDGSEEAVEKLKALREKRQEAVHTRVEQRAVIQDSLQGAGVEPSRKASVVPTQRQRTEVQKREPVPLEKPTEVTPLPQVRKQIQQGVITSPPVEPKVEVEIEEPEVVIPPAPTEPRRIELRAKF
ncbi:MAG: hypothetical protein HOE80_04310 [Candidatus Magasanikbacteria bacterium]|jgi:hypothetical protein|nr:hypothetical protein [Candidatus Magasanikbacteria bacterium]MBT4071916.1 hypothetical protein [Candidatus Magasanikbacteria bacterium]